MEIAFPEDTVRTPVETKSGKVELPILYRRARSISGIFLAPIFRIKELLPSGKLVPVEVLPNRTMMGFSAFEYQDTSIGPYNEVGITIPVRYLPSRNPVLLPALKMSASLNFDVYVWKLPVTTRIALDAGIEIWGYPKFLAEITFSESPSHLSCHLVEEGREILTLKVRKLKPRLKTFLNFNTYTILGSEILWTTINGFSGGMARSFRPGASKLELGNHPLADLIRELGLSSRALMALYIPELQATLPAAEKRWPL